jgi:uncharacterized membrane protein
VGSMVSAFSAASSTATPRSFKLIIGMMFSKCSSVFIGSFIYSIGYGCFKERLLRHSRKLYIIHIYIVFFSP